MALPTSYMTGSFTKIPSYFETMLTAKAPEKFNAKFMSDLGYTSSNDRQFVNVLKAIGFIDDAGTPTNRYFTFLDQSTSKYMVAEGIQEAYGDLFALNISAQNMTKQEIEGKFKTLTEGTKENATISYMASTFLYLCSFADWSKSIPSSKKNIAVDKPVECVPAHSTPPIPPKSFDLNYNIHIHLPTTRDQAVYDALFASLTKHILIK